MNIMEWVGGNPESRDAKLTVSETQGPACMRFSAYWERGYCGCVDCHCIVGYGATEQEAIDDYWELWENR
jgi:hypothetical protein